MKKRIALFLAACLLAATSCSQPVVLQAGPAHAREPEASASQPAEEEPLPPGWEETSGGVRLRDGSGGYAKGFTWYDGAGYWFDADGFRQSGWIETPEGWLYAGEGGALQTGLVRVDGKEYYLGDDYIMDTGWISLPDGYRYAGEDGALVKSRYIDGKWVGADGYAVPDTFALTDGQVEAVRALLTKMPGASVVVEDLVSGSRWEWDAPGSSGYFYIASVYKLPYALWLLQRADRGEIDLDEEIEYTAALHVGAAGIIQDGAYGDAYTVRTLIEYMIVYSDNTALSMLKSRFPVSEFKEWINGEAFGLERPLNDSTDSVTTAPDCCTFAAMAFRYMESGAENAAFFREIYTSTDDKLFRSELEVGQKYGWWDNELHSAAVVYAGRPYAIAMLTGWGERTEEDDREFQELFDLVLSFFTEGQ